MPDADPLAAIRDSLTRRMSRYNGEEWKAIAAFMTASKASRSASQSAVIERELLLYEVLCEVWRQPERRLALRLTAMAGIGALRVAAETWQRPGNKRPLQRLLKETFDELEQVFPGRTN